MSHRETGELWGYSGIKGGEAEQRAIEARINRLYRADISSKKRKR